MHATWRRAIRYPASVSARLARLSSFSSSPQAGVLYFAVILVTIASLLRVTLALHSHGDMTWDASLLAAFAWGFAFDVATAAWASVPIIIALTLTPPRVLASRAGLILAHVATFAWIFGLILSAVAEFVFWDEFGTRFNFVTVDYLVYTQELLGNVRESYPLPLILTCIAVASLALTLALARLTRMRWLGGEPRPFASRLRAGLACLVIALALGIGIRSSLLP